MARDKLITVRIEGEKRQAFGDLAKSQNTDTASLLYDFISGCLDGRIDISLVTGKKQWIDKIDNQLDSERIDKLETATQRLDERLDNWIWVSERSLENNLNSLRDQVNALAIQLNRQQIDRIDTDSQQDSQKENPDMGTVATVETADSVETVDTVEPISTIEPVTGSIDPVRGEGNSIESVTGEAVTKGNRQGVTNAQLSEKTSVPVSTIENWKKKIKEREKVTPKKYPDFFKQWTLNLDDSLWYEVD